LKGKVCIKEIKEMDIAELAAFICDYLFSKNIRCTLSGGACVSIYSNNEYQSYDLDFIEEITTPKHKLRQALQEIGFEEENRYFKHHDTQFILEFPSGPLAVGAEPVKEVVEIIYSTGKLRLLSPTDCIKDRLAAFFYWDDLQSLEQALKVSKYNIVDFKEIKRWVKNENQEKKYLKIEMKFKQNKTF